MSVTLSPWGLSNPGLKPGVITVVIIVVLTWGAAGEVVSACSDILGLVAVLFAGHVQQRSTATTPIVSERR